MMERVTVKQTNATPAQTNLGKVGVEDVVDKAGHRDAVVPHVKMIGGHHVDWRKPHGKYIRDDNKVTLLDRSADNFVRVVRLKSTDSQHPRRATHAPTPDLVSTGVDVLLRIPDQHHAAPADAGVRVRRVGVDKHCHARGFKGIELLRKQTRD